MRIRSAPAWLATDVGRPPLVEGAGRTEGAAGDATRAMGRVLGFCALAVRGGAGVLGGFSAVLGMTDPVRPVWLFSAVLVNLAWVAIFVLVTIRRGLRAWVMAVDVALTAMLCLVQGHLVAAEALPGGASWVSVMASMTVVCGHLAWRPGVAIPAGVVVAVAYAVGQHFANSPADGIPQAAVMTLQNVSAMGLMMLVRRVSTTADTELHEYYRAERKARIRAAQRTEEREANRRLHDTVLATLTMVGSGALRHSSATLRARARADLAVVAAFGAESTVSTDLVWVDHLLRQVAHRADPPLRVELSLTACEVPDPVGEAFAWATAEALTNVVRHAGVDQAWVALRLEGAVATVSVSDRGVGFDPGAVGTHHFGLREAIRGRMAGVGGSATVESAPGKGTRVALRWSAGD